MKRAKLLLDQERLTRILNLPEGTEIITVSSEQDPIAVWVHLTGPDFPEKVLNEEDRIGVVSV